MKKQYSDHWANLEDMHLLTRMRMGQFITNFMQANGYVMNEKYSGKDVFYMTDDDLLKRFRDFYNGKTYIEPVVDFPEAMKIMRAKPVEKRVAKKKNG